MILVKNLIDPFGACSSGKLSPDLVAFIIVGSSSFLIVEFPCRYCKPIVAMLSKIFPFALSCNLIINNIPFSIATTVPYPSKSRKRMLTV